MRSIVSEEAEPE